MDKQQMQLLHGIANDVVNEIIMGLSKHFKSGDLQNSVTYEIDENGNINIIMLDYWKYLEYGTPGTKQGVTSTVAGKTVSLPANPNRKMPIKKEGEDFINLMTGGKDYALAKYIQEHGTRPYPFVRPVLYTKLPEIVKQNMMRMKRAST